MAPRHPRHHSLAAPSHSNTVAAGSSTGGGLFPAAGTMAVAATILDDPVPCSLDGGNLGAILSPAITWNVRIRAG
ncbi:MAG: hypothetical protein H6646_00350 [Anaerolineales bacterium]|nr:hypothetical protein [Anaerolineales bacterium]